MRVFNFQQAKDMYEAIKPIRGTDIRPAGDRRQKWVHITRNDSGASYSIRFASVAQILFTPDNEVHLINNTYPYPSTAQFFSTFSPFYVTKEKKRLWVKFTHDSMVPLPNHSASGPPVSFRRVADMAKWECSVKDILVNRINRKRAAESRQSVKPFADYCYTMLKLSDGWVTAETMIEGLEKGLLNLRDEVSFTEIKNAAWQINEAPEFAASLMMRYLIRQNHVNSKWSEKCSSKKLGYEAYTKQYSPNAVRKSIYDLHDSYTPEIFDVIAVQTDKSIGDIHGVVFQDGRIVTFRK